MEPWCRARPPQIAQTLAENFPAGLRWLGSMHPVSRNFRIRPNICPKARFGPDVRTLELETPTKESIPRSSYGLMQVRTVRKRFPSTSTSTSTSSHRWRGKASSATARPPSSSLALMLVSRSTSQLEGARVSTSAHIGGRISELMYVITRKECKCAASRFLPSRFHRMRRRFRPATSLDRLSKRTTEFSALELGPARGRA